MNASIKDNIWKTKCMRVLHKSLDPSSFTGIFHNLLMFLLVSLKCLSTGELFLAHSAHVSLLKIARYLMYFDQMRFLFCLCFDHIQTICNRTRLHFNILIWLELFSILGHLDEGFVVLWQLWIWSWSPKQST